MGPTISLPNLTGTSSDISDGLKLFLATTKGKTGPIINAAGLPFGFGFSPM